MLMPDVNVLLYAHRSDEAVHRHYRKWLDDLVSGHEPFALSTLVAVGFVRIATNPRIYPTPTPVGLAVATIEALVAHPGCRLISPGQAHWPLVASLCRDEGATGKSVGDAQHAAVAIEHGCTWVTRDGDFAKFVRRGLRWSHLVLGGDPPAGKRPRR
jgi:toxin-antitoxin system PIN domain toxin